MEKRFWTTEANDHVAKLDSVENEAERNANMAHASGHNAAAEGESDGAVVVVDDGRKTGIGGAT